MKILKTKDLMAVIVNAQGAAVPAIPEIKPRQACKVLAFTLSFAIFASVAPADTTFIANLNSRADVLS